MPWNESWVMEERLRFVARSLEGEGVSDICRSFGISRKTRYRIFKRHKEHVGAYPPPNMPSPHAP